MTLGKLLLSAVGLIAVPPAYFPGESGLLAVALGDQIPAILNHTQFHIQSPVKIPPMGFKEINTQTQVLENDQSGIQNY